MSVITIAHELGSSGREIGRAVAQQIGLDYVDREIIAGVAQKLGISEQLASDMDEKAQSLVMRLLSSLSMGSSLLIAPTYEETVLPPDEQEYQAATRKAIEAAAATRHAVIAGHGANLALAGQPGVLNVFIYAPHEQRIQTLMARDHISHDQAHQKIHDSDHDRTNYVKTLYNANWHSPLNYHLMINTAIIKPALAVALISQATQSASF